MTPDHNPFPSSPTPQSVSSTGTGERLCTVGFSMKRANMETLSALLELGVKQTEDVNVRMVLMTLVRAIRKSLTQPATPPKMNAGETSSAPQPILPGVPVPFPCWLWSSCGACWVYFKKPTFGAFDSFHHYLVAPATADPATFPSATGPENLGDVLDEARKPSAGTDPVHPPIQGLWDRGFKVEHPAAPTGGTTTPRTDAVWSRWNDEGFRVIGPLADCSRQIERELFVASALALDINDELTATKDAYKRMCELMEQAKQCATDLTKRENELEERIATLEAEKSAQSMMVLVPVDEHDKQEAELADLTCRLALTEKRLGEAQGDAKNARDELFLLQNRVMHAAGPAEQKSACAEMMTQTHFANLNGMITGLRAQLTTSQARLVEVEAEVERLTPDHNVSAKIQDDNIVLRSALAAAFAAANTTRTNAESFLERLHNAQHELELHQQKLALTEAARVQAKQDLAETQQFFAGSQNLLKIADREAGRLIEQRDSLRAANTALSAQVEELKRDGERIQWLEDTPCFGRIFDSDCDGYIQMAYKYRNMTIREAIDAARAQEEGA